MVKTNVYLKQVDKLGRVVLPIEMRRAAKIGALNKVTVSMNRGQITIEPYFERCAVCGSKKKINPDLHICLECIEKVKKA